MKKRKITMFLAGLTAALLLLVACGEQPAPAPSGAPSAESTPGQAQPTETAPAEKTQIKVGALVGPTGMGFVNLMAADEAGTAANDYDFTLAGAPEDLVGKITSGEIDVAAVPTNMAAVLYNKTSGKVKLAALNTLGVLYIVEKGESIQTIEDLKGKTIVASGQGAVPEYIINYILSANGLEDEVKVEYKSEHSEVAALLGSGGATVAMLPEPFVTSTKLKVEGLRSALDLTEEWAKASEKKGASDSVVSMGGIIVRTEFLEENQAAFDAFLAEYKASIDAAGSDVAGTAKLIVQYEIMAAEKAAEMALPGCNIVYVDGEEMKASLANFLNVLHEANPQSVGGTLPADDFYYVK